MSIVKNPFGVGESGHDLVERSEYCDCCNLRFRYTTSRRQPRLQTLCPECCHHVPDGTLQERHDALLEHEPRLRDWINKVHETANKLEAKNLQMQDRIRDQTGQVAEALESRDRYRATTRAALSVHGEKAPNRCRCGQPHPCVTTRAVEEADRGIARYLQRHVNGSVDDD